MSDCNRDALLDPRAGDVSQFGVVEWCRFNARRHGALCVGFEDGSLVTLDVYRANAEVTALMPADHLPATPERPEREDAEPNMVRCAFCSGTGGAAFGHTECSRCHGEGFIEWCAVCGRPKNDCGCVENGGNY